MTKTFLYLWMCLTCLLGSASASGTTRRYDAFLQTQEKVVKHATFITLRLTSTERWYPSELPTTTPRAYTVDEWMRFQLFITQTSTETFAVRNYGYYDMRVELIRDGDVVPYKKEVQEIIADQRPPTYVSGPAIKLVPAQESRTAIVALEDWYETPLRPGRYQLILRKRFVWEGDWVESNPVNFDVIPRKQAAPIPDCVSVRLIPEGSKTSPESRPYRLAYYQSIAVDLINDCDGPVEISVVDRYYGHRLQLFKDEKLIPYSAETAKLIASKDKDPRVVEVFTPFFLEPKTTSRLGGFSLSQWYSPLPPGIYRLTDRRRLQIEGPWTKDSDVFVFEVVP